MSGVYVPGEMSRRYEKLSAAERAVVDRKADELFRGRTGIVRRLDAHDPADRQHVRAWLRIRDDVISRRPGTAVLPTSSPIPPHVQPQVEKLREAVGAESEEYQRELDELLATRALHASILVTLLEKSIVATEHIAKLWVNLRRWGLPPVEIARSLEVLVIESRGESQMVVRIVRVFAFPGPGTSRVVEFFKSAGHATEKVGLFAEGLALALNVAKAIHRDQYGAVAAEIYKFGIGKAVPWGGLIDTLQQFVAWMWPGADTHRIFKYLRVANPVAMGSIAVDTAGTLIHCWVSSNGNEQRLKELTLRMKEAGAASMVEIGDDFGDALFQLSQMSDQQFHDTVNAGNIYRWLRSFAE